MLTLPPPLASFLEPWLFMSLAISYLPSTILNAALALDLGTLLSPSSLRSAWFGRFWTHVGPTIRSNAEQKVIPLLQGRVTHGLVPAADGPARQQHPAVSGTVLELGPGTGLWTSLFGTRSQAAHSLGPFTKIYGVEPNASVHAQLRQRLAAAGIGDGLYEVVPVGVQDLRHHPESGIRPDSIDCIVTVMCLCSIPDPRENIRELYKYLKPGGRWYVYEHVQCLASQPRGMRWYQRLLNCIWPTIIGGCEMTRDTAKYLREAGPWSDSDLFPLADEPWYFTMPHIIGVLRK
ncbi:hypothetical protein VTK26DRAFT_1239 [Humicola hyalothermophila]